MRNLVLLFLLALSYHSSQSLPLKSCKRKENVMNCTGMGLTDCPTVKKQITNLILDNNLINNFTTPKCQKWNLLKYLSIRNNQLKEIQLNNFIELVKIDLSNNSLVNINLKCPSLTTLIVNSNKLSDNAFNGLINDIHSSPLINNLDLSNNLILKLPIQFMTLKTNSLLSLNISGNKLSQIDFSIFNKQNLSIDFSNNHITEFTACENNNIFKLNFSNNQLTKINGERMNNFVNLKSIDLSNNPLSCFCNESKSFIQWIIQHKSIIVNSGNTWCKTPIKQSIFDVICSSTTPSNPPPITTSTTPKSSNSNTTSSVTTHNTSTKKSSGTTHRSSTKKSSGTTHSSSTKKSSGTTHRSSTKKSSGTTHSSSTMKSSGTTHRSSTKKSSGTTHRSSTKKSSGTTHNSSTKKSSGTTHRSSTKKSSGTTHNSSTKKSSDTTHRSSTKKSSGTTHNSSTKKSSGTTHSSSTKKSSGTTHNYTTGSTAKPSKVATWKIVLEVIIPLAAILAIIACYFWFCRNKSKYQRFDR